MNDIEIQIEELEEKIKNKTITPNEIVVYMSLLDQLNNIDIYEE